MKKILLLPTLLLFSNSFSQKIADRYQSSQPQDQSVPPPPRVSFPAQFPNGNKAFLKIIDQNINRNNLKNQGATLNTEIILKIDKQGNVLNISTYGKNEIFNKEVKNAATKSTQDVKWTAGKNSQGQKVIDIVKIPYRFRNL
ncbi:hypothetical protein ASG31_14165 [Chryseobacterium sp. Leaf404]|uniref:hypothetical protein n=1 Tax=unclassified Chryseobacterium TaxID=2593645 RepID=UPI0006F59850|nr:MULTISPECIES: hypothetical protein [unclassified Chryseobacterium]KQT16156.1 hypothetical protein ASG31_14165 [Chryseobacterium sp. Leaf404]